MKRRNFSGLVALGAGAISMKSLTAIEACDQNLRSGYVSQNLRPKFAMKIFSPKFADKICAQKLRPQNLRSGLLPKHGPSPATSTANLVTNFEMCQINCFSE